MTAAPEGTPSRSGRAIAWAAIAVTLATVLNPVLGAIASAGVAVFVTRLGRNLRLVFAALAIVLLIWVFVVPGPPFPLWGYAH